jgi:hypothetical protein
MAHAATRMVCEPCVVGEKPSQAAWDRPWIPWEGCEPSSRRAFPMRFLRRG